MLFYALRKGWDGEESELRVRRKEKGAECYSPTQCLGRGALVP